MIKAEVPDIGIIRIHEPPRHIYSPLCPTDDYVLGVLIPEQERKGEKGSRRDLSNLSKWNARFSAHS